MTSSLGVPRTFSYALSIRSMLLLCCQRNPFTIVPVRNVHLRPPVDLFLVVGLLFLVPRLRSILSLNVLHQLDDQQCDHRQDPGDEDG